MKKYLLAILFLTSLSALARTGGESGGGGNGAASTPDQTEFCITGVHPKGAGEDFCPGLRLRIFEGIAASLEANSPNPVKDPEARRILSNIMSLPVFSWVYAINSPNRIMRISDQLKIEVKRDGPCFESGNGEPRDASMTYGYRGDDFYANLCVSVPRLTRYPISSLAEQLPALFVHELAPAAGHGEKEAIFIQNYILERWNKTCDFNFWIGNGKPGKIEVVVSPMGEFDVVYSRYFEPQPGLWSDRNNSIVVRTRNYPGDYLFRAGPEGGEAHFLAMNDDGSYSPQTISWGPPDQGVIPKILAAAIELNGKHHRASGTMHIYDCSLR